MAYSTLPIEDAAGMNVGVWQSMASAQVPDQVVSGLVVSIVGTTIRIGAGKANLGGCTFINTSNVDIGTIAGNSSGQTRIDRVILRLTVIANSLLGGGASIDIQPAVVSGFSADGPALTQNLAGTYEIPLARWAVLNGSTTPFTGSLIQDGPGPCAAGWAMDAYKFPSNVVTGFDGLGAPGVVSTSAAYGPSPASVSGQNLRVTLPGLYSVSYRVQLQNAGVVPTLGALPWSMLVLPDDVVYSGLQLGLNTAGELNGRARISETFAVRPDQLPFEIQPRLYQATGALQDTYLRLRIVRHAA